MKTKHTDIMKQNRIFVWIAIATGLILLVPLVMTKLGSGVEGEGVYWTLSDFVVMGTLLFGTGSLFVLAARKLQKKSHRIAAGIAFLVAFLYVWAELAVGIFTNLGS